MALLYATNKQHIFVGYIPSARYCGSHGGYKEKPGVIPLSIFHQRRKHEGRERHDSSGVYQMSKRSLKGF